MTIAATLLLFFALYFCASIFGGWHQLARLYRTTLSIPRENFHWQSAKMKWGIRYRSCLQIGLSKDGLYLSIFFPFRCWHPPLLIPWAEIVLIENRKGVLGHVAIGFKHCSAVRLVLSEILMQSILGILKQESSSPSELIIRTEMESINVELDSCEEKPRFVIMITVWLILTVALAFVVAKGNHYGDLRILAEIGVTSVGRIESLEPTNHDKLVYSYEVGGVVYHGYSRIGEQNSRIGDTLSVVYSPNNPSLSTLSDASKSAIGTLILAVIMGAVISALLVFALVKRGVFRCSWRR